tara:strand:+ start:142 stop:399 length:258 start_codon:yes stop_codon:yes gene_type:complete
LVSSKSLKALPWFYSFWTGLDVRGSLVSIFGSALVSFTSPPREWMKVIFLAAFLKAISLPEKPLAEGYSVAFAATLKLSCKGSSR